MPTPTERHRRAGRALLGPDDPPPVELANEGGRAPLVLICDHAGRAIPKALDGLGLPPGDLDRHIAYDIGAAAVARVLARRLDAPAVLASYSRLVIDSNRSPGSPDSIVAASDGTAVPGNQELGPDAVAERQDAIFWPYHRAIAGVITRQWRGAGRPPVLFSVHSFTPVFGGKARPWHVGLLWNRDRRLAGPLLDALHRHDDLCIGDNEPYSGRSHAYSVDVHGGVAGLANCGIEIRQDQVDTDAGAQRWGAILADAVGAILEDPALYKVERH